jgi:hypothetical protein
MNNISISVARRKSSTERGIFFNIEFNKYEFGTNIFRRCEDVASLKSYNSQWTGPYPESFDILQGGLWTLVGSCIDIVAPSTN